MKKLLIIVLLVCGLYSENKEKEFDFLNSNNSRIDCDDVCGGTSTSQFVCDLCLENEILLVGKSEKYSMSENVGKCRTISKK